MTTTPDWTALNTSATPGQLLAALTPLDSTGRTRVLTEYLEQQIKAIRQLGGLDTDLDMGRNFVALGFDSLMSVELLYNLQRDLGRDLDPAALEQPTIDDLARVVLIEVFSAT